MMYMIRIGMLECCIYHILHLVNV